MADGIKKISENVIVENRALVVTNPLVPDNDAISIGALQSDPANRGLRIKTSKGVYSLLDATQLLAPLSITNNLLGPNCVTSDKIAPGAVGHDQLADDSVCEWKLKTNSVTRDKIKNEEVIQGKLATNAVITKNLVDNCVVNSKISNNTIENSKLFDKTILNTKIADKTIIESLLDRDCVTEIKIKDSSVTNRKLADRSVYGDKIGLAAINNDHLAHNSVNTDNILNGAVTHSKLADYCIYSNHINDSQILTQHLYYHSVTHDKLDDNSVSTWKLQDKSVTKDKLADDVLNYIGDPVQYDLNNNVYLRHNSNLTVPGNIEAGGTITAQKIYNAVFMDIAEAYTPAPEETLVPGDIVELRQDGFVYKADSIRKDEPSVIVGVVSNEYAACYGATEEDLQTSQKVAVGMIGKVHVNVVGPVKIGDYIGACKNGIGISKDLDLTLQSKHIIVKALESNDSHEPKKVLCLIFPN